MKSKATPPPIPEANLTAKAIRSLGSVETHPKAVLIPLLEQPSPPAEVHWSPVQVGVRSVAAWVIGVIREKSRVREIRVIINSLGIR